MLSRLHSFEGELSTQTGLSEHLANRALDAYLAGDTDAFRYASEIHDDTQTRIAQIEEAKASITSAAESYRDGSSPIERVVGAVALGGMILNRELEVA